MTFFLKLFPNQRGQESTAEKIGVRRGRHLGGIDDAEDLESQLEVGSPTATGFAQNSRF
jgi:hypothetical protein